jgi:hypothetical protein
MTSQRPAFKTTNKRSRMLFELDTFLIGLQANDFRSAIISIRIESKTAHGISLFLTRPVSWLQRLFNPLIEF